MMNGNNDDSAIFGVDFVNNSILTLNNFVDGFITILWNGSTYLGKVGW